MHKGRITDRGSIRRGWRTSKHITDGEVTDQYEDNCYEPEEYLRKDGKIEILLVSVT
jgi:hypothetical protein